MNSTFGTTQLGWMALISFPMTCALGYFLGGMSVDDREREPGKNVMYSAMSRAQMPVPVPRSRIFCGFLIGALWSSPFVVRSQLEFVRGFRNVTCGWF